MTDLEAVALAHFGYSRRRLLGTLVRHWLTHPLPEIDDLPERVAGEPFLEWACRCAGAPSPAAQAGSLCREAARLLRAGAAAGQCAVSLVSPDYPRALALIPDPPAVLWRRGAAAALGAPRMVAVVGARAASRPGLAIAAAIGGELAAAGVIVVSGLARGVDTAAHRAALEAGGRSVAVLGSGLDRVYPREHAGLADALAERGAVISECPPGMPPLAHHFPQRNRIISGLAAATVVVEASEKSGSLITAGTALEQGREVMAVPGPVAAGRHRGAHALLRDGATLVESGADVLAALGWAEASQISAAPKTTLDPALAAELGLDPTTDEFDADDVCAATGCSGAQAGAKLGALEISGRIRRIPGGRFVGSGNRVLT
jgi:DNA processing protein